MFVKASVVSQTPVAPVIAAALVGAGVQANGKCPSPTKRPGDTLKVALCCRLWPRSVKLNHFYN